RRDAPQRVHRPREDDLVETKRAVARLDDDAAGLGTNRAHVDARPDLAAGLGDRRAERVEDLLVSALDVAELLLLRGGAARREHALDIGPDENGRDPAIVLPELREQQRLPQLLVSRPAGDPGQPGIDRDALEAPPIVDARAVQDRRGEPRLVPQRERRKAQKVERAVERMEDRKSVV